MFTEADVTTYTVLNVTQMNEHTKILNSLTANMNKEKDITEIILQIF